MYVEAFMRRAVAISADALGQPGLEPFGSVVVKDGKIVGEGINRSLANLDPTSHGETEAIRDACRNLGTVDLSGCELYTSCEPCALCVATMAIAGIEKLYYAASMGDADEAFAVLTPSHRHPIDVEVLRTACCAGTHDRAALPAEQAMAAEASAVLRQWASAQSGS